MAASITATAYLTVANVAIGAVLRVETPGSVYYEPTFTPSAYNVAVARRLSEVEDFWLDEGHLMDELREVFGIRLVVDRETRLTR